MSHGCRKKHCWHPDLAVKYVEPLTPAHGELFSAAIEEQKKLHRNESGLMSVRVRMGKPLGCPGSAPSLETVPRQTSRTSHRF